MSRTPDFFIVGAPKCGTTALNDYLARHPDVFVPGRKEIHFFGSDLVFTRPRMNRDAYLRLFDDGNGRKRAGEASVWYLYSQRAAREIRDFSPQARILIMLRHPVDMMYSLHSQRLYDGNEDLRDFADALAAEPERQRGARLPRHFANPMDFFYRDAARFAQQVRRYFETFGRERCHVILFDDLQRDVARVYRNACAFLDVDSDFRPGFPVVNANKNVWSRRLRDLLRFPSPAARSRIRAILPSAAVRKTLKRRLLSLNGRHAERPPIDPELRRTLDEEFLPEIRELGRLLDVDLVARWCRRPAETDAPLRQASVPDARAS